MDCIECEHWRNVPIDRPTKAIIENLMPQITVTIQKVYDYCKLGHTKPKEKACRDFKKYT